MDYETKDGVVPKATVELMVNEYEHDPEHNQEGALYKNLCELAESHEVLRKKVEELSKNVE